MSSPCISSFLSGSDEVRLYGEPVALEHGFGGVNQKERDLHIFWKDVVPVVAPCEPSLTASRCTTVPDSAQGGRSEVNHYVTARFTFCARIPIFYIYPPTP